MNAGRSVLLIFTFLLCTWSVVDGVVKKRGSLMRNPRKPAQHRPVAAKIYKLNMLTNFHQKNDEITIELGSPPQHVDVTIELTTENLTLSLHDYIRSQSKSGSSERVANRQNPMGLYTDTLNLMVGGKPKNFGRFKFGATKERDYPGTLGLGLGLKDGRRDAPPFLRQISDQNLLKEEVFTLHYEPSLTFSADSAISGQLTLGGHDTINCHPEIHWVDVHPDANEWAFPVDKIRFRDRSLSRAICQTFNWREKQIGFSHPKLTPSASASHKRHTGPGSPRHLSPKRHRGLGSPGPSSRNLHQGPGSPGHSSSKHYRR